MANRSPRIKTYNYAEGIDSKIETLQNILSDNLLWLDHSFGLATPVKRNEKDRLIEIPVAFVDNTSDPIDLRPFPDDLYRSYSFWDMKDPAVIKYSEGQEFSSRKYSIIQYEIACIFVVDCKKIDNQLTYKETRSHLRDEIFKVFEDYSTDIPFAFYIKNIFERDINKIFDGYTLDEPEKIISPYYAFRVEGLLEFKRKCPISYTYSVL